MAFSVLYNIPRFLEISWEEIPQVPTTEAILAEVMNGDRGTNQSGQKNVTSSFTNVTEYHVEIVMTEMRQNPLYISIYITWMYLVFM